MRQGGRVLERHPGRHRLERLLPRAHELGERAAAPDVCEQVSEDLVARLEPGRGCTHGLDDAGDVDPHAVVPRRP